MKNVKKLLKEHKSEILPDKKTKDNIKRELWPEDKQYTLTFAHGGERTADERRRNKITRLCVAALIIVLIFGALVPVLLSTRRKSNFPMALNKFTQITDADSFYAYGAASVGNILSVSGAQPVSAYASTVRNVARSNVAGVTGFSKKPSAAGQICPLQLYHLYPSLLPVCSGNVLCHMKGQSPILCFRLILVLRNLYCPFCLYIHL